MKARQTVAVLMSTYNGEAHLTDQLDSVFGQEGIKIVLYVRDDGSGDGTLRLLRTYAEDNDAAIRIIESQEEGNVGVYESWNLLLEHVPDEFEYYALCDQDDIWAQGKLARAIEALSAKRDQPALYTHNTLAVDGGMRPLREYDFASRPICLESLFARYSVPAHSMVWNQRLMDIVRTYRRHEVAKGFTLEQMLTMTSLAVDGGDWVRNPAYDVLWRRQTEANMTASGNGLRSRIAFELREFRKRDIRYGWARSILGNGDLRLRAEARCFLEDVVASRKSCAKRVAIAGSKRLRTGIAMCDFVARTRALLPRW